MEIPISKHKKIVSDNFNWIYYEERLINKTKKTWVWEPKWFYPSIQNCYLDLMETFIKESEKETLREALEETVEKLKNIEKHILKA